VNPKQILEVKPRLNVEDDTFVHFTSRSRAKQILETGKMLFDPPYKKFGTDTVDAVSTTYGIVEPLVQTDHSGSRATEDDPLVAVVFQTDTIPCSGHPDEVKWLNDVVLRDAKIVSKEEGIALIAAAPYELPDHLDAEVIYWEPGQRPHRPDEVEIYENVHAGSVMFSIFSHKLFQTIGVLQLKRDRTVDSVNGPWVYELTSMEIKGGEPEKARDYEDTLFEAAKEWAKKKDAELTGFPRQAAVRPGPSWEPGDAMISPKGKWYPVGDDGHLNWSLAHWHEHIERPKPWLDGEYEEADEPGDAVFDGQEMDPLDAMLWNGWTRVRWGQGVQTWDPNRIAPRVLRWMAEYFPERKFYWDQGDRVVEYLDGRKVSGSRQAAVRPGPSWEPEDAMVSPDGKWYPVGADGHAVWSLDHWHEHIERPKPWLDGEYEEVSEPEDAVLDGNDQDPIDALLLNGWARVRWGYGVQTQDRNRIGLRVIQWMGECFPERELFWDQDYGTANYIGGRKISGSRRAHTRPGPSWTPRTDAMVSPAGEWFPLNGGSHLNWSLAHWHEHIERPEPWRDEEHEDTTEPAEAVFDGRGMNALEALLHKGWARVRWGHGLETRGPNEVAIRVLRWMGEHHPDDTMYWDQGDRTVAYLGGRKVSGSRRHASVWWYRAVPTRRASADRAPAYTAPCAAP
jgi:hypothetical protein